MICVENGYKVPENVKYKDFDTSMDYLQKIISRFNFRESRQKKSEFLPFMSIVKEPETNIRQGYYYSRKDELIRTIREAREDIKRLYLGYEDKPLDEKEDVRIAASERRQDCIEAVMSLSDNPAVMYLTLKELDNRDSKDVSRLAFDVLFGKPNEAFYKMLKESREDIYTLDEDPDGDIDFYGLKFSKRKVICEEKDNFFEQSDG